MTQNGLIFVCVGRVSSQRVVMWLQLASVVGAFSSEAQRKPDILVEDGDTPLVTSLFSPQVRSGVIM